MSDSSTRLSISYEELLSREIQDSIDEEMEIEFDDTRMEGLEELSENFDKESELSRMGYFRELLRLQGELVKLQDWVVHKKLKVVVLFEGRDSAGKGGVIKRVTQRLNPRVCRVAALPTPNDREKSCCSTAAGITAPVSKRSWAFATTKSTKNFFAPYRSSNACWCAPESSLSSIGFP
jgi:hypothetical protein